VPSRDRQRVLARAKLERQMARRAAAARRRRQLQAALGAATTLILVVGGTWFLVNKFSGDEDKKDTASPKTSESASPSPSPSVSLAPGNCAYGKAREGGAKPKNVGTPPTKNVKHTGTRSATLKLNKGTVEVQLDIAKAPCTTNSFTFLAGKRYFDNTKCHRLVVQGIHVLQCGDPTASGSGGPGYQFGEENLPKDGSYPAGVLAMANAGPGTNGSQFFIVYKNTKLPPNYTIFGKITKGLDVVEKIAAAGVQGGADGAEKPKSEIKIEKVSLGEG
jgi:peptidyl-prolyl cis-trans isomerase B (cyclophilin B)